MSYYYGRRRSYRSAGHERALQHIREAHELSEELGGSDEDVKKYFFSLRSDQLKIILDDYQRRYGENARQYAEKTLGAWKSGTVHMSGQTAARLFRLLPAGMPLKKKHDLVEKLWDRYSPRSAYTITFGPDAELAEIRDRLRVHVDEVVQNYQIPDALQRRFEWLSDGDSHCVQELLNHFLGRDRELATTVVEEQVKMILATIDSTGSVVKLFRRTIEMGGHTVTIVLDPKIHGVELRKDTPLSTVSAGTDSEGLGCIIIIAALVGLWLLIKAFS